MSWRTSARFSVTSEGEVADRGEAGGILCEANVAPGAEEESEVATVFLSTPEKTLMSYIERLQRVWALRGGRRIARPARILGLSILLRLHPYVCIDIRKNPLTPWARTVYTATGGKEEEEGQAASAASPSPSPTAGPSNKRIKREASKEREVLVIDNSDEEKEEVKPRVRPPCECLARFTSLSLPSLSSPSQRISSKLGKPASQTHRLPPLSHRASWPTFSLPSHLSRTSNTPTSSRVAPSASTARSSSLRPSQRIH